MDKKQAIVNTLFAKIQERSKKLFEDVSDEMWNDIIPTDEEAEEPTEKDFDLEVDGEEIEKKPETALDVILNSSNQ